MRSNKLLVSDVFGGLGVVVTALTMIGTFVLRYPVNDIAVKLHVCFNFITFGISEELGFKRWLCGHPAAIKAHDYLMGPLTMGNPFYRGTVYLVASLPLIFCWHSGLIWVIPMWCNFLVVGLIAVTEGFLGHRKFEAVGNADGVDEMLKPPEYLEPLVPLIHPENNYFVA